MRPAIRKYRKFAFGDKMQSAELANGIGTGGAVVGALADTFSPADKYGKRAAAGNILSGVGQGAALGANFGPLGAGIGAVGGAVAGLINNKKQKDEANKLRSQELVRNYQLADSYAKARVSANPEIVHGDIGTTMNGYYAAGGPLSKDYSNVADQQMSGGSATPLNASAAEFNGNTHAEGGIQIPAKQAEVEGGETTNGDYVFSEQLGFAKLHKPIATAIGKIEKKTLSPERVASIKLLKEKENQLKLQQEYVKHSLGLNQ